MSNPDMINPNIAERIIDALENNSSFLGDINQEFRQQAKALIDSQINKAGLVSRDEFDALRISLNRSNERLVKLEKEINSL